MTELLGEGCYGQVSKAIYNGIEVAAKNIEKQFSFDTEIGIFKHIENTEYPNIVYMKGYDTDKKIIYMDLVKNSIPLEDFLSDYDVDIELKEYYLEQIIQGVIDLIKSDVFHGDFKAKNILINEENDKLFIHDFGFSSVKDTNLKEYRYEIYIIILQMFLEEDAIKSLIHTGYKEGWLEDVDFDHDRDIPQLYKDEAYDYPKSYEVIYHLFDKLGSKYFIEKNLLNSEIAKKYFNLLLCL